MQVSRTLNNDNNDYVNRANLALLCSQYFGIKDVSPNLYLIAAPVSELAYQNKNGENISDREEIEEAIPWNERSMKTFGVVYIYEATASFIGLDGITYVVPMDKPVLDHLVECGYVIAPYGKNLDGKTKGDDSLVYKEPEKDLFDPDFSLDEPKTIDRNLPPEIVSKIDEIENGREYYRGCQSYIGTIRFGGSLGLLTASEEELEAISLSERKVMNITTYGRVHESEDLDTYIARVIQDYYLNGHVSMGQKL